MKLLLTGANGFIGSHVARVALREGHEVHALVRAGSERARLSGLGSSLHFVESDLRDNARVAALVSDLRPETCVHLGWFAEPGKYWGARENLDLVTASLQLASALADNGCQRLVSVGTCAEYDTDLGYLSERTPLRPQHLYSSSKAALALMLEQLGASTGMAVAWARLFYLYGPAEDPRRLVSSVTRALLAGSRAKTTHGAQVRDFLHVADVAEALWAVATSGVTGAVNVGSGAPVTVRQIVEHLGAITGRPELIDYGAVPYGAREPMFICADNRRLLSDTTFRPRYSLVDGLTDTVEWWRQQREQE